MQAYSPIAQNIYKHCVFHHIIFKLSFFLMSKSQVVVKIKNIEFYRNNADFSYLYRDFYMCFINILCIHKKEIFRSNRIIDIIYNKYKKAVITNLSLLQPLYIVEIN